MLIYMIIIVSFTTKEMMTMEAIIQMLLTDSEKLLDICKTDFEEVTNTSFLQDIFLSKQLLKMIKGICVQRKMVL